MFVRAKTTIKINIKGGGILGGAWNSSNCYYVDGGLAKNNQSLQGSIIICSWCQKLEAFGHSFFVRMYVLVCGKVSEFFNTKKLCRGHFGVGSRKKKIRNSSTF
jgi:hypothetical protein